jgi:taurine transport system substrate-binding protein
MSGGNPEAVIDAVALYEFPSIEQQTSCKWLGCGKEGKAAIALKFTADFLKEQKKIRKVDADYSKYVNPSYAIKAATYNFTLK